MEISLKNNKKIYIIFVAKKVFVKYTINVSGDTTLAHWKKGNVIWIMINFKILKIDGKTLVNNKNNVKMTLEEAERQLMIIGLARSQIIDWCLESKGTDYKTVSEQVIEIKKAKEKDSRDRINELVFLDEILQIVISSKKEFDTVFKGFKVNGHEYKYLASKGSSEITFVRDDLYELFTDRLNANRDMSVKMYSSKLNAYKSLALSSSEVVSAPKKVIVMRDCNVKFNAEYLWVDETIEHRNEEVERCINDGCFFISPKLARVWSDELNHPEKMISAFQVRFLWTKGIVYTVDFHTWCAEHDCECVTDIWGEQHRIEDVDVILGENMVKLWSSYDSCNEWLNSAKEHHYDWRVSKYSKPIKMNNLNYQELLPLNLTYDDVKELLTPSIEHIKQISGNDYESMLLYLNGVTTMSKAVQRDCINNFASALAIEPKLMNDKFLLTSVANMISKRKNGVKLGEIQVDALSSYQIIVSDPIQLLEHLIGIENPKGVLNKYEVYSANHEEETIAVASRAPLLVANNLIKITTRKDMNNYNKYFEYLQDVYCVDGCSLINESLCGLR